jgi:hypothetical protein
MKIFRITAIVAASILLSGCSWLSKEFNITTNNPIPIPDVKPVPLELKPVQWQVYTVDELKAMVAQMEANGNKNAVFYVMDQENFNALAYNIAEMKRFIEDQKSTNEFLVKAIEINNGTAKPSAEEKK